MPAYHLACDLGAESGRVMLGALDGQRIDLEEIHRFTNTPIEQDGHWFWDVDALFAGVRTGLKRAGARGLPIASVSTDSWGVDYMLFDASGAILAPTFHYRDGRTAAGVERVFSVTRRESVYEETGIQYMPINTLFQLAAETPERLARARQLLNIGDGFNFLLSGVARGEQSLASTSQLYNPRTRSWSRALIKDLGLPARLFPAIVPSGTRLGPLRPGLAAATGLPTSVEVIAGCSHDTGCAVAAVPASGSDWAYLSSGTWSLMGVECAEPVISPVSRDLNFTNEIGFGGSIRFLKNIIGLWLVQECRRHWAKSGQDHDYATLTRWAARATPFVSMINPADARFMSPGDMPGKIAAFCRETNQAAPAEPGAFVRCALESLALLYRRTLREIERALNRRIRQLHVVGGGSRNELLNQFIANALELPVIAGPAEASALGNVLIQALALQTVPSLEAGRAIIRNSTRLKTFQPEPVAAWREAEARFERLPGLSGIRN